MNQLITLVLLGSIVFILLMSLHDDWKKYKFRLFEPKLERIPIKNTHPKINKKTIRLQRHIINSSIRTKI